MRLRLALVVASLRRDTVDEVDTGRSLASCTRRTDTRFDLHGTGSHGRCMLSSSSIVGCLNADAA